MMPSSTAASKSASSIPRGRSSIVAIATPSLLRGARSSVVATRREPCGKGRYHMFWLRPSDDRVVDLGGAVAVEPPQAQLVVEQAVDREQIPAKTPRPVDVAQGRRR